MEVDNVEGPQVRVTNEVKLLYTSLAGLNTPFDLISLAFGIFLVVLGLVGYLSTGSVISLIASVSISLPIFVGSYLATRHIYWSLLSLVATLALFIMTVIRLYKNPKFYPSGLLVAVSIIFLAFLTTRLVLFYRSQKQPTGQ